MMNLSMKADRQSRMQLKCAKTITSIQEQYITGQNDENKCLGITEQYQSKDTEGEIAQSCKTELDGSESDIVSSQGQDNCNELKQMESPICSFFQDIRPSQIEFKLDELRKATKGFSQNLGSGAFGSVFAGILSDGRQVAVKILRSKSRRDKTEWMNELRALTKLQQRNITELVGYCFEDNMTLVYDYMQQSLDRVIWGEDEMIIDWPTRYKIILDIIRGLAYLQEGTDRHIVHRNLKPSNILLDENLNAKISDFSVARILQPGDAQFANKDISTKGGVFLKDISKFSCYERTVVGTAGYFDPEYFETQCLTLKVDIYSFGVLVLNVVSGKRAWVQTEDEMYTLPAEAWRLYEADRLTELIDPRLINTEGLINSSNILRTIKIALWCVEEKSDMRPSASRVLEMFSSEEEIPIPTPDQSFYEYHSEDDISSCTSSCGKSCIDESSVADDHSSEQEIPIPTLPLESCVVDDNFSEEEIPIPTLPHESSRADDEHYSEEKIPIFNPPLESLVVEDHSSEEEIPIASPPVKSLVAYYNSLVKKIEESDRK